MKYQVAALGVAALAACDNASGHLESPKTGDVTHLAERGSPVDALRAACGDDVLASANLERRPYLQQVGATGALLGWVTSAPANDTLALTDPLGSALRSAPGVIEASALRTADEKQMWSSLDTLESSTTYCYQLTNDAGVMTSRTGFRTAPAPDSTDPVRFLAFGDSGGGGGDQWALREQMYTVPYDLMIHTGDVAYESGTIDQFEVNVFGVYADLFRNISFFPAPGNHDYLTMNAAPFREVFNLPGIEKWYSYDWGRVHFVALDTESDYRTQAVWLEEDLAASTAPWTIVYMHRPMFSSGSHGSDTTLRAKIAPILESHGVQLVLAGHDHDYERMIPQGGVAYVVTGGGGKGTRSVGASSFTAFAVDVIHFVYVEVGMDELVLHAIDASGREFDSMLVPRTAQ